MKNYLNQKGFTLSELLVVIAIILIVTAAVSLAYTLSQKAYRESEKSAEITQNGRVIIERMTREIRQAKEIVGDFPSEREDATSTITFEDGHTTSSYNYIHYFKTDSDIEREVIGYYFSDDAEQTLQPWDAVPPGGQTLESKTLEEAVVIGEWVDNLELWGSETISIALNLKKADKTLNLETEISPRNF